VKRQKNDYTDCRSDLRGGWAANMRLVPTKVSEPSPPGAIADVTSFAPSPADEWSSERNTSAYRFAVFLLGPLEFC
jgi:hypothetical protein